MRKDSKLLIGNPQNPPIVFLHGFMGSKNDWLKIVEQFQTDYFCILVDLIGHGDNLYLPKNILLNYKNVSDQILSILDQLNIEKITLVGYSLGGRIGLYTALNHPRRITSLVIESANPGIENENARKNRMQSDNRRVKEIEINGLEFFIEKWYQIPLFESLHNHLRIFSDMVEERKKNNSDWMMKVIQELSPGVQPSLWSSLHKIDVPTLLISGILDTKYQQIMKECKTSIKGSELCSLDGAGHNSHAEKPVEFSNYILNFIEKHKS